MSRRKAQSIEALIEFCEDRGIKIEDTIQVGVAVADEDIDGDSAVDWEQVAVYSNDAFIERGTRGTWLQL